MSPKLKQKPKPKFQQAVKKLTEFAEDEELTNKGETNKGEIREMKELSRETERETEEVEKEKISGMDEKKNREIVIPGQVLSTGLDFLPGEGTIREGNNIIATRFGLLDTYGRLVKVIPLTGIYLPKKWDFVIGKIVDITPVGWQVDINSIVFGMIAISEGARGYVTGKTDMMKYFTVGDSVAVKISEIGMRGAELTFKGPGLKKLESGLMIEVNPNKVPRVIGKMGSMITLIKTETDCNIMIGQNGVIWINGQDVEKEILAKEAIKFVERNSHISDLTEKVKIFLKSRGKK